MVTSLRPPDDPAAIHIDRFWERGELGTRAWNALHMARLETVGQIAAKTEHELLRIRNFGLVSLLEVRAVLKPLGIELAPGGFETPTRCPRCGQTLKKPRGKK